MAQKGRKMHPLRTGQLSNRTTELTTYYDCDRNVIFSAYKIKVGEKQKYEIVI